jgi:hypothetical protein
MTDLQLYCTGVMIATRLELYFPVFENAIDKSKARVASPAVGALWLLALLAVFYPTSGLPCASLHSTAGCAFRAHRNRNRTTPTSLRAGRL